MPYLLNIWQIGTTPSFLLLPYHIVLLPALTLSDPQTVVEDSTFHLVLLNMKIKQQETYEKLTNKIEKMNQAKDLGYKGTYQMMRLPYHNRVDSACVDGMHTIRDVVTNIMDALLQRKNHR